MFPQHAEPLAVHSKCCTCEHIAATSWLPHAVCDMCVPSWFPLEDLGFLGIPSITVEWCLYSLNFERFHGSNKLDVN